MTAVHKNNSEHKHVLFGQPEKILLSLKEAFEKLPSELKSTIIKDLESRRIPASRVASQFKLFLNIDIKDL